MPNPTFTVITTTYNRRDLLPRAIKSVLDQTFKDFEYLIIDNGSKDDTAAVVNGIKDSRLQFIVNPAPTRSCDAPRNLGIRMAAGEFISFLDDDDLWYPAKLEKTLKAFKDDPAVSVVCHYQNKRVGEKIEGVLRCGPSAGTVFETLLYDRSCLIPSATTIRTGLLRGFNGFRLAKEFDGAADYDLWLRMAEKDIPMYFIKEPLGEFTASGVNWSVADPAFQARYAALVREHIMRYENRPEAMLSRKAMTRLFQLYAVAGNSFLKAGRYAAASKYYSKAALFVIMKPSLFSNIYSKLTGK